MEGAILDRKLRYGHESVIRSLRSKTYGFRVEIEKIEFQLCSRRFEFQVDCRLQMQDKS